MQITERMDFFVSMAVQSSSCRRGHSIRKALADLMTRAIDPSDAPVIELGPGTGVFTRALLDRGIPEERLFLIEYGSDFAESLRRRFPRAQVLQLDAAIMSNVGLLGGEKTGAVVSGLPFLSMRPKKVMMIMKALLPIQASAEPSISSPTATNRPSRERSRSAWA